MKRTVILCIALTLILSLCACADKFEEILSGEDGESSAESTNLPGTDRLPTEETTSPESDTAADTESSFFEDTTLSPESESQSETEFDTERDSEPVTEPETEAETEPPESITEAPETEAPPITDDPAEDDDYLNIQNVGGGSVGDRMLAIKGSDNVFKFTIPTYWELSEQDGKLIITDNSTAIGSFSEKSGAEPRSWKTVATAMARHGELWIVRYIEKSGARDTLSFRYRYVYSFTENGEGRELTLSLAYPAVYASHADKLLNEVSLQKINSDPGFGVLDKVKNGHLLILGNSFVNTSSVGGILGEMMQKNFKGCAVTAVWRSYATVDTYVRDVKIKDDITSGKYEAVFICGLYSEKELENLEKLKGICDSSSTKLVIFPAHNESREVIEAARERFPGLVILDWKAEIDMFIQMGGSKWDFCKNDSHKHSTPLAGYVGAHMIYRAIYGEVPSAKLSTHIEQSLIDSKLGEYPSHGYVSVTDKNEIIYIG